MERTQIYYFTGKNRFALGEERRRWEQEFSARHGAENASRLRGAGLSLRSLLDEVSVAPFLAEKRLVTVDGVPKFSSADMQTLQQQIHPSVILLITEEEGARPTNAAKELATFATVKTFAELRGSQLAAWMQARAAHEGAVLSQSAVDALLDLTGEDQRFLEQQICILALRCAGRTIEVADVKEMTVPAEKALWGVTNALAAGHNNRALLEAEQLLRSGADAMALWHTVLSFLRQLSLLVAGVQAGITSPQALADKTGIHPYVLRSLLPCAKRVSLAELRRVVDRAVDMDVGFKTGQLRMSDDATAEITAVLDVFLLRFP